MTEPPERSIPKALRRIETGVTILLASSIGALAFVGFGPGHDTALSQTSVGLPGGAAVALILGIIFLNALFVAGSTAIEQLKPLHLRHFQDESNPRAERLQFLLDRRVTYTAACLFGSHVCRVGMVLAGLLLTPGVANRLQPNGAADVRNLVIAATLIAIPILLLNLIFELIPKSFASLHPAAWSLRLFNFVTKFAVIFAPPASLITAIGNLITARFGARASFAIENQAEEEIKSLVEEAKESGSIEEDEQELLHSVFEFTDTIAREVMTPRIDLDALPAGSDPEEVARVIEETGHSRIPLYEETDDQIVGIVHAKDLLSAMRHANGQAPMLKKLMRPAYFVPETKNLHDLLAEMRANKTQMAIVQDEFGGTAGIVTIEDIVEELVGEIVDEYDVELPEIIPDGDAFLIDGKTDLDDVNDALSTQLESDEFDTVGGYVFGLFGRQPRQGESTEAGGLRFTVSETDGRRILRLHVERMLSPAPDLASVEDY